MKLVHTLIAASAALVLAACSQASSNDTGNNTPKDDPSIETFESYADSAAVQAAWPKNIWDTGAMASGNVSLETASPLDGSKSLHIEYGSTTQFAKSDFPTKSDKNASFFSNVKNHYTADRTGIQLTIRRADWDAIWVIIRGDNNDNAYQAKISDTLYHTAGGDVVKIPFDDFTYQSWGGSNDYASLKAALAAGYAFTDFTIEPEVDDTTTTALGTLKDLYVDDVSFY